MPQETREPVTGHTARRSKAAAQVRSVWATLKAASNAVSAPCERLVTSAFHLTTRLLGAILTVAILLIFLKTLFSANTVDLRTIEVPDALSDMGLTSKVVTWKLRDALNANRGRGISQILPMNLLVMQNLPDVSIPETALSIDRAVGIVRNLLPAAWQHDEIYGAFTLVGKRLSLELRLNEKVVYASSIPFSPTNSDVRDIQHQIATAAFALTVKRYSVAIQDKPTSAPLRIAFGYLWVDHRRWDNAIDSFKEALALDPSKPDAHSALGHIERYQHNPDWDETQHLDEAQRYFQAALDRDPKFADAHTGMGYTHIGKADVYAKKGDTELAKEEWEKARQAFEQSGLASGGSADSRVGLAHVYWGQGNLNRAVEELQKAIRLSPNAADAHILLGSARRTQRRFEDAIASYAAAALLNPLSDEPHLGLGGSKLALNKWDDAVAEFGEAIRLSRPALTVACEEIAKRAIEAPGDTDYPELRRRLEALAGGTERCPSPPAGP
ncbi:tetratricopeptide repeat protein [Paracraurococcus lichenis]|uniref:Tetratricopeptide repeat protein n=1 Tax=Paracraurococcus lichenis TaxID=3064888 RepID=A0ABT9E7S3_9PROT|nr:tetratricopeptide repeat protein [Paracraurococcus sp. LOR1-02]MDO9712256.1 tetratricopeptide repeat protein [Paracraurococcus sp. LOR1-02]